MFRLLNGSYWTRYLEWEEGEGEGGRGGGEEVILRGGGKRRSVFNKEDRMYGRYPDGREMDEGGGQLPRTEGKGRLFAMGKETGRGGGVREDHFLRGRTRVEPCPKRGEWKEGKKKTISKMGEKKGRR